jgi:RNA polymerase sigma factor (sigma-70 family)
MHPNNQWLLGCYLCPMNELRPLLTTYAYNILGSREEAKDVVQDAYLKFMAIDSDKIEDKKAYLVRTVINLSINAKNRQLRIKAEYPGTWLPEPVAEERADTGIIQKEVLSYSLMVLLEKLNPKQRAVFILKEAFDYGHEEIADVLHITTESSRKLLSRAKEQLHSGTPVVHKPADTAYLDKYLAVIHKGDTHLLEQLLHDEVTIVSDGGGKATAAVNPLFGLDAVSKFLVGVFTKTAPAMRIEKGMVNHEPALFYYIDDKLVTCQVFIIEEGKLTHVYFLRNPDKLAALQK